jgi:hypothetical protein
VTDQPGRDHLPETPYPGIEPFDYADRGVFFLRDAEARALVRLVVMYRGVLLYSDSGTGKSSLINAALVPLAIEEGYQPERIRVRPRTGEELVVERFADMVDGRTVILPSIFAPDPGTERTVLSADRFLSVVREQEPRTQPLLIFDQFEEWVTLFEEGSGGRLGDEARANQERIREVITTLIADGALPVKILLAFREDYLARLTPIFERCPTLPDQYLRLNPLRADQIRAVIRGPFERHPKRFRVEIGQDLAEKIQSEFQDRSGGADIRLTEVQIVCRNLFESGKQGSELDRLFAEAGGVQGILERYLEGALESLPDDQREPAVGLLRRMVTSAGTRNVISGDDLISRVALEDGLPHELVIRTLHNLEQRTKLVRRERRREVYYYEVASEFLIGWIREKALEQQRLADQRKLAADEQQRRVEEQAKAAGRLRRLVRALVAVSIVAVAAFLLAVWGARTAEVRRLESERARETAIAARELADRRERELRSRMWASAALENLDLNSELSLLLAIHAGAVTYAVDKSIKPEVEDTLKQALERTGRLSFSALPPLSAGDLLALALSRATRSLTPEECQVYLKQDTCPSLPDLHRKSQRLSPTARVAALRATSTLGTSDASGPKSAAPWKVT